MMQDWDQLDLLEQGEVEAASQHLAIRIDSVPVLDESNGMDAIPKDVSSFIGGITFHHLTGWQLVPTKLKLTQAMIKPHAERWNVYRLLNNPYPELDYYEAVDIITPINTGDVEQILLSSQVLDADQKL